MTELDQTLPAEIKEIIDEFGTLFPVTRPGRKALGSQVSNDEVLTNVRITPPSVKTSRTPEGVLSSQTVMYTYADIQVGDELPLGGKKYSIQAVNPIYSGELIVARELVLKR